MFGAALCGADGLDDADLVGGGDDSAKREACLGEQAAVLLGRAFAAADDQHHQIEPLAEAANVRDRHLFAEEVAPLTMWLPLSVCIVDPLLDGRSGRIVREQTPVYQSLKLRIGIILVTIFTKMLLVIQIEVQNDRRRIGEAEEQPIPL